MAPRISIGDPVRRLLIAAGVICLLLAAWRCPYVMGKKTTGFVHSIYRDRDETGTPVMKVGVTYTRYRGTNTWQVGGSFPLNTLPADIKVGDKVTLFYSPGSKNAWLASGIWVYPLAAAAVGTFLTLAGFAAPRRSHESAT